VGTLAGAPLGFNSGHMYLIWAITPITRGTAPVAGFGGDRIIDKDVDCEHGVSYEKRNS